MKQTDLHLNRHPKVYVVLKHAVVNSSCITGDARILGVFYSRDAAEKKVKRVKQRMRQLYSVLGEEQLPYIAVVQMSITGDLLGVLERKIISE